MFEVQDNVESLHRRIKTSSQRGDRLASTPCTALQQFPSCVRTFQKLCRKDMFRYMQFPSTSIVCNKTDVSSAIVYSFSPWSNLPLFPGGFSQNWVPGKKVMAKWNRSDIDHMIHRVPFDLENMEASTRNTRGLMARKGSLTENGCQVLRTSLNLLVAILF